MGLRKSLQPSHLGRLGRLGPVARPGGLLCNGDPRRLVEFVKPRLGQHLMEFAIKMTPPGGRPFSRWG